MSNAQAAGAVKKARRSTKSTLAGSVTKAKATQTKSSGTTRASQIRLK
jgi:hypothetical protein